MRILLSILIMTISLSAQDPRYGLSGGLSLNQHSGDFAGIPGYESCCPGFREGTGMGPYFSFIYQYPLMDKLYLDLKAGMYSLDGEISRNENTLISINDQITNGVFKHNINAQIMNFSFGVGASYNLFSAFNLTGAFRIGSNISGSFDQKEEIVSPSNTGVFIDEQTQENLGRVRNEISGDINDLSSMLMALDLGADYLLPLNEKSTLFLVPEFSYSLYLSDNVQDLSWTTNSLNFGLGIRYAPVRPKKIHIEEYKIDTLELKKDYIKENYIVTGVSSVNEFKKEENDTIFYIKEISRVDTLFIKGLKPIQDFARENKESFDYVSGEIEIVGLDSNKRAIDFSEIKLNVELTREIYPLLPYVFFNENSSVIPDRYDRVVRPDDFDPEELDPSPIVYHRNNLNIIGNRLVENPSAKLTITGYVDPTTEEGKCDLAYDRAVSVKGYLMRVFNIEEDRLKIEQSDKCYPKELTRTQSQDGFAENRRVEITTDRPELLFAVSRTWLQQPTVIEPAAIMVHTIGNSVKSDRKLTYDKEFYPKDKKLEYSDPESWTLDVEQGQFSLLSESGSSEESQIPIEITRNNARKLQNDIPITVNFSVFNEKGMSITKTKELIVTKDTAEIEVEKLTLTVFRVSQASLDNRIKEEIREFVTELDQNSEVNIIGYSDNIGDETQNKNLSAVRAEAVRKYIRSIAPRARFGEVIGVGSDRFPPGVYSYVTPEERFISRTVEIEIRKKAR